MRQKQARHEDALELIGRAIRVRPGVAVYHNNYGAALLSLSRFAEAEASIRARWQFGPITPTRWPTSVWPRRRWAKTRQR